MCLFALILLLSQAQSITIYDQASGLPIYSGPPELAAQCVPDSTANSESKSSSHASPGGVTPWVEMGGPPTAYVSFLSIHPTQPGLILCSTAAGGVYRSENAGASWSTSRSGMYFDWPNQIAWSPSPSDQTVYCAANQYWKGDAGVGYGAVYRSDDFGNTWTDAGLPSSTWLGCQVLNHDSNIVLASGTDGMWRSMDDGATWSQVWSGGFARTITQDPTDSHRIYAGTFNHGVLTSSNSGASWTSLPVASGYDDTNMITVHSSNPDILVAASSERGLFRSIDRGLNWDHSYVGNIYGVMAAPSDSDLIYAIGEGRFSNSPAGLYFSTDAGATWSYTHPDVAGYQCTFGMGIAVHPTKPKVAYFGLYRAGVLLTVDGGDSFLSINRDIHNAFIQSILVHPTDPNTVWASAFQAGLWKTTDGGNSWQRSNDDWDGVGYGGASRSGMALDPSNPNHLLLGLDSAGIHESFDRGDTWSASSGAPSNSEFAEIEFSQSNPAIAWAGCTNSSGSMGAWMSTNGGSSWSKYLSSLPVFGVSIHPTNTNIVLAATNAFAGNPGAIWRTTNGGGRWTEVYSETSGAIYDVEFSPVDPAIAWACSRDQDILLSTDGGLTWNDQVGGALAGSEYAVEVKAGPHNANRAYFATKYGDGMLYTLDQGATVKSYSKNLWLPTMATLFLKRLGPSKPFLLAGTSGDGIVLVGKQ